MYIAAYLRVSTDEQAARGTIENQRDYARKYADLHNMTDVRVFEDEGVSGTLPLEARPAGKALLEAIRAGEVSTLLIYKIDRLSRSLLHFLRAVEEIEQYQCSLRSMTEVFDTATPIGRLMMQLLSVFAEHERRVFLDRTMLGKARSAHNGRWWGGIIPTGYTTDPADDTHTIIPDDTPMGESVYTPADLIRLIFHLAAERHYSSSEIAAHLNTLQIPPRNARDGRGRYGAATSGLWRHTSVLKILHNDAYSGVHHYRSKNGQEESVPYPELVPCALWQEAQRALTANSRVRSGPPTARPYLLHGLLYCSCGHAMHGEYSALPRSTERKVYYRCAGRRENKSGAETCRASRLPGAWIEAAVWEVCAYYLAHPAEAVALWEGRLPTPDREAGHQAKAERATISRALAEQEHERARLIELYGKGLISTAEIDTQLRRANGERERLQRRARELEQLGGTPALEDIAIGALLTQLGPPDLGTISEDEKRTYVQAMVRRVDVPAARKARHATITLIFGDVAITQEQSGGILL